MNLLLLREQRTQYAHDAHVHFEEIARHRADRLKSLALRLSVVTAARMRDGVSGRGLAEVASLALGGANLMMIDLSKADISAEQDERPFQIALADVVGILADAAEKIDHLEEFVGQAKDAVVALLALTVSTAARSGIDLCSELEAYREEDAARMAV